MNLLDQETKEMVSDLLRFERFGLLLAVFGSFPLMVSFSALAFCLVFGLGKTGVVFWLAITLYFGYGYIADVSTQLRRYRYSWRHSHKRCTVCGYQLIGLKDHRCPECGTSF